MKNVSSATIVSVMRILANDIQSDDGVANAAIGEAADRIEQLEKSVTEMRSALAKISAIAHHGGLIGFSDENACLNEVRRVSLKWWYKKLTQGTET